MTETRGPVHLIGIGGIHMSAIGQLLREQGVAVSGSDLRPSSLTEKLAAMGATVAYGHAAANVPVGTALVVTTAAAADDNPELGEARRRGIPVLLRAEMVARLMEGKRVVAVSGAHGKTTTSSLIAHILVSAGREPMYLLGGESLDLGGHASWGNGDICVVEADEYKRAFHEYTPDIAIILNVEPDHLDYYGTAAAYRQAFVEFGKKVKEGGIILACADDPGAREVSDILSDDPIRQETYGIEGVRYWMAGTCGCQTEVRISRWFAAAHRSAACTRKSPASTSSATRSPRRQPASISMSRSTPSPLQSRLSVARGGASNASERPGACW
jgi:UDP-N-acetylmuramate--alanine ligase